VKSTSLTPSQRSLRARVAAHALHAQGKTSTAAATAAQLARYEREVDPDGELSPEERTRRAGHAMRANMALLAFKASRARTKRSAPVIETPGAESEDGRVRGAPD
jgi:hypothetical protein